MTLTGNNLSMAWLSLEPFPGRSISMVSAQIEEAATFKDAPKSLGMAVVDSSFLLDSLQVVTAACSVLAAQSQNKMLTRNQYTELLYRLCPSKNVSESLRMMGLKDGTRAVCCIAFDISVQEV